MPFLKEKQAKVQNQPDEVLRDRGLLAPWFMAYRLEQEIERARRYGRPLSVMMAEPALLPNERYSRAAMEAVAEAAHKVSRNTDLVGWADEMARLVIIMPETDGEAAQIAATRLRDELWIRTRAADGHKWEVGLLCGPEEAAQLLAPAQEQLAS